MQYCRREIEKYVAGLGLKLNNKTNIFPLRNGIDFLGFRTYMTDTGKIVRKVRRNSKCNEQRKLKKQRGLLNKGENYPCGNRTVIRKLAEPCGKGQLSPPYPGNGPPVQKNYSRRVLNNGKKFKFPCRWRAGQGHGDALQRETDYLENRGQEPRRVSGEFRHADHGAHYLAEML